MLNLKYLCADFLNKSFYYKKHCARRLQMTYLLRELLIANTSLEICLFLQRIVFTNCCLSKAFPMLLKKGILQTPDGWLLYK